MCISLDFFQEYIAFKTSLTFKTFGFEYIFNQVSIYIFLQQINMFIEWLGVYLIFVLHFWTLIIAFKTRNTHGNTLILVIFFVNVSFGKDENTANAAFERNLHIDANFIILIFSKTTSLYFINCSHYFTIKESSKIKQ